MPLFEAVQIYIERKRSLGVIFEKSAMNLRAFSKRVGDVPLSTITPGQIVAFLNGPRTSTVTWRVKFNLLKHFFEYWGRARNAPGVSDAQDPSCRHANIRSLHLQ